MRRQNSYFQFHDSASTRSAVTGSNTENTSVLFSWLRSSDASVHVDFESFDNESPMKNQKTCIWILYAPMWTKSAIVLSFFLLIFSVVFLIVIAIMRSSVTTIATTRTSVEGLPFETASVSPSLSITSSPNNLSPHPSLIHSGQPSSFPSMVHSFFPAHTIKSNSPTNEFSQFPTIHPTKLWTSPPTSNGPSLRPSGQSFQSPTIYPSQEPFIIPASETRTSFFVMADRYRLNQYPELIEAMSHIPADVDFAIHLGDFNNVLNGCNDTSYKEFRDLLVQNMPISTFVIPGDNELNDCPNPIEAWEHWNTYILNIETHWDDSSYKVTRQRGNEENFAFRLKSVLCIGLNMVGGKILDRAQWKIQMDNNVHWVESQISAYEEQGFDALVIFGHASDSSRYDYFFEKLVNEVKQNGVPTIYIHESNEHFELSNHAFNTSNFWIASVRGGFLPFANVIVDTGKPEPFTLIINALR